MFLMDFSITNREISALIYKTKAADTEEQKERLKFAFRCHMKHKPYLWASCYILQDMI